MRYCAQKLARYTHSARMRFRRGRCRIGWICATFSNGDLTSYNNANNTSPPNEHSLVSRGGFYLDGAKLTSNRLVEWSAACLAADCLCDVQVREPAESAAHIVIGARLLLIAKSDLAIHQVSFGGCSLLVANKILSVCLPLDKERSHTNRLFSARSAR